ncbi:Hypothetical predicted protein [Paramuricea clavata]|uniref:Uncharacterized protein n=1 Tax=Paramuricea clavata TaxID=317549 RepID=A0A6S7FTK8_PARCT|nr:Hypothetical predicted protein [Paramuricea clavata]
MDDFAKFSEPSLPPQKEFYSSLTDEDITDEDYEHAKKSLEVELEELRKSEEPVEKEVPVEKKRELQTLQVNLGNNFQQNSRLFLNFLQVSLGKNFKQDPRPFLDFLQKMTGPANNLRLVELPGGFTEKVSTVLDQQLKAARDQGARDCEEQVMKCLNETNFYSLLGIGLVTLFFWWKEKEEEEEEEEKKKGFPGPTFNFIQINLGHDSSKTKD